MDDVSTADSTATSDPQRKLMLALARILHSEDMQDTLADLDKDATQAARKESWETDRKTYVKKARSILRKLEKKGLTLSAASE